MCIRDSLQVVVIVEAQRFMQPHPGVQLEIPLLEEFFAAGVARIQNGHVVGFGQTVDGTEQVEKIFLGVDAVSYTHLCRAKRPPKAAVRGERGQRPWS